MASHGCPLANPSLCVNQELVLNPLPSPLHGIRVVDLSAVLSGPLAAAMLADQGAEVIKVETLEGDTCRMIGPAKGDLSAMYIATNRGKQSLAMDLKTPESREILTKLLKKADVVINNFRPGVMERLGWDDDTLAALNPRLIRVSITGYGNEGQARNDRVYDAVIQAVAGVAATQRNPINGQPTVLATALSDKLTALTASQAIVSALFARERDGQGRRIAEREGEAVGRALDAHIARARGRRHERQLDGMSVGVLGFLGDCNLGEHPFPDRRRQRRASELVDEACPPASAAEDDHHAAATPRRRRKRPRGKLGGSARAFRNGGDGGVGDLIVDEPAVAIEL